MLSGQRPDRLIANSRFTADTRKVKEIERDCRLSEKMLRALIVRNDELTEEQMKNAEAAQRTMDEARLRDESAAPAAAAAWSRTSNAACSCVTCSSVAS